MRMSSTTLLLALMWVGQLAAETEPIKINIVPQPLNRALEIFAEQAGLQVVYVSDIAEGLETGGYSGSGTVEDALLALLEGTELTWNFANERTVALTTAQTIELAETEPAAGPEQESEGDSEAEDEADSEEDPSSDKGQSGIESANEDEEVESSEPTDNKDSEAPTAAVEEEITVSAQVRKQNLRDVPVSVTVISGESLHRQGLVSVREIARQTPGFSSSTFSESEPIFAIRGANNTFSQAGASKPVGIFLDGVYISRNGGSAFDLYDLDQVEVLRGPQGTLFGRNVTGGAVLLTTSKPEFGRAHAKFDLGLGKFGAVEARGLVGGSLSEKVSGKLSSTLRTSDGYGEDRLTGLEQNDLDTLNLRGQLSFLLGDSGLLRLTADISDDENNGRTLSTVSPSSADDGDIRTSEHGHEQVYKRDMLALSMHGNWTTSKGEFESITAYRETDSFEDFAFSSAAFEFLPRFNPFFPFQQTAIKIEKPETFSQEFRLVSKQYDRFDYVVGLYYFDEKIRRDAITVRLGGGTGDTIRDQSFDQNVDTESFAAYADVHFKIGETVHLNLGGRFTDEEKKVQVDFEDQVVPTSNFQSDDFRESWSEFTPRLALTWRPQESLSLFASFTQGFTAGGFNTEEDTPEVIGTPFDPETLTAYEVGIKTGWLDNRLTLNAALFHQEYKDKQEGFLDPRFNFVIVNAAEATMEGAEVALTWALGDGFRLNAFYAYLDATYDDFFIERTAENRSGNFLPTSPETSLGLGFDYRTTVRGLGGLGFNASYTRQDDYFTGSENRDTFLIESYGLLNAGVSFGPSDSIWRLTAWGKNLADEEYILIRSDFGVGGIGEHFGAPREYGLRLTLNI
jgi:iron complex outermembrane receptor protein